MPAPDGGRRMLPDEDARAEALRIDGWSLSAIARELRRPRSTIQMALLRLALRDKEPST